MSFKLGSWELLAAFFPLNVSEFIANSNNSESFIKIGTNFKTITYSQSMHKSL